MWSSLPPLLHVAISCVLGCCHHLHVLQRPPLLLALKMPLLSPCLWPEMSLPSEVAWLWPALLLLRCGC